MSPAYEGVSMSFFRPSFFGGRLLLALLVLTALSPLFGQRINEFNANHTSNDTFEYIEIFGSPNTDYSHLTVVQIEADVVTGAGLIDTIHVMGTTDADGYFVTPFFENQLGNGAMALLLVEGYSGNLGDDLDTNDDGTFETTPWTNIIDSLGVDDGDGDPQYAAVTLGPNYDGISFTPGGASFLPAAAPTGTPADWIRNDFHGAGLPGFPGTLTEGEAVNTPGVENTTVFILPALISEFVLDHVGTDTNEFLEIWGTAGIDYSFARLLVVDGDSAANPGQILNVITPGTANNGGFWASDFSNETFSNSSVTLMLVADFSGAVSDDLDAGNDGTFDSEPWDSVLDAISVRHNGADVAYATVILEGGFGGAESAPGGASRYPYYADTDSVNDWSLNDFDGEGLDGFRGDLNLGETINTPARVSRVGLDTYYQGLGIGSGQQGLRDGLHAAIDDHIYFPYTDSGTDTWDILEQADQDPGNENNVLTIYKNATYAKQGGGNSNYNREHSWPSSYGFTDNNPYTYPYTDAHHLRIADSIYNSTRSNIPFGECNDSCSELATDFNDGRGGQGGDFPGDSNWFNGSTDNFQVWNGRKGDIARSLLYLDIRYDGGNHVVTEAFEPNLILTDNTQLIQTIGSNTDGDAYMGRLSVLLQWHQEDPVDDNERLRNEIIYSYQGNRNPFVDRPEWVDCVFNGNCSIVLPSCFNPSLPSWTTIDGEICQSTSAVSVLHYVSILNNDCVCATP